MRSAPLVRLAGLTAAAALALTACRATSPEPSGSGDTTTAPLLTIGSLTEPTSWDPAQANEGHFAPIYQSVYDTLIKREPDGSLSPMLATDWTLSDDKLTLQLDLRDDVTFTDGAVFNADAVKANMEHFQSANGPLSNSLASVESVEVVDDDTVAVHLSSPDPDLPISLTNAAGYMGSPDALGSADIETTPVGSGPYVLDTDRSIVGSQIVFTRNPDYWGDPLPFDEVDFKIFTDETARLNALTTGQVDFAALNRASSALQAQSAGLNAPEPFSTGWAGILFFDRDGALLPELADVRVREALAIAIDREAIVDVSWQGLGQQTSQVFGKDTLGYEPSLDDAYPYDPDKARELLTEAGASNLTVTLPISNVFDPSIYDAIIQNWEDIGVTVNRHEWGPGEAIPSMLKGEFPLAFMQLVQRPDWGNMNFLLTPDATWNPLGSTNAELDGLIAQYPTADEAGQADLARQINEWVVDNYWFAPVLRPDQFNFYNDTITVVPQVQQAVPSIYNYAPSGQ